MRYSDIGALAVVAGVLVLAGCGDGDPAAPAAAADDRASADAAALAPAAGLVTPAEAAELALDPDVSVIDVRTPEEYAEGHLDRATLVDIYEPDFRDRIAELDPDGRYLVYCRSGNRSGQAVALMTELGFEQVHDLDGGVLAWSAEGMPLTP